jgi:hypothetical protein
VHQMQVFLVLILHDDIHSVNSSGSSVSIVAMLRPGRPGFESRRGAGIFYSRPRVQTVCEPHPASYAMDTVFFTRGEAPGP